MTFWVRLHNDGSYIAYIAVYIVIRDEVQILRIRHGAQAWPPSD
jgi:plasmid stabilization system protein ParE